MQWKKLQEEKAMKQSQHLQTSVHHKNPPAHHQVRRNSVFFYFLWRGKCFLLPSQVSALSIISQQFFPLSHSLHFTELVLREGIEVERLNRFVSGTRRISIDQSTNQPTNQTNNQSTLTSKCVSKCFAQSEEELTRLPEQQGATVAKNHFPMGRNPEQVQTPEGRLLIRVRRKYNKCKKSKRQTCALLKKIYSASNRTE